MTKQATHGWLRRVGIGAVAAGMILSVVGLSATTASANHTNANYTICHATASNSNPYSTFTVDEASVDGLVPPQGDHFHGHTGPVWDPTLKAQKIDWGDIIPPVPGHHAGLNWDAAGQAIYNNGCAIPGAASTYECSAATAVTHDSATLNATTSDAAVTEAVFTLQPGNLQFTDNTGGSPFSVDTLAVLAPNTAYTYTVEFNPGATPQSNAACGFTTLAAPPTYECAAPTAVTHDSATLNGSTTDAAATSAVFTLVGPNGGPIDDIDGAPFTVNATGLAPSTAYTYTVVFNPGGNAQSNATCGFTTAAAPVVPGPVVVPGPAIPPAPPAAPAEDECPDQEGFQDNVDQCVEVQPDVVVPESPVVPEAPVEAPTDVEGVVVTRELPRTGSTTLPLLQVGLGLILLGAGAVLFGRERTALI